MNAHTLDRLLRLDGAANVAAGLALVALGGWLAGPLGLTSGWPVRAAGLALVAYGIENLLVARRPTAAGLFGLAVVDLAFGGVVLGAVITDPTSAQTWARWALVGVADLSALLGVVKLVGRRSLVVVDQPAT